MSPSSSPCGAPLGTITPIRGLPISVLAGSKTLFPAVMSGVDRLRGSVRLVLGEEHVAWAANR